MIKETTIADMVRINREMMLTYARTLLRSHAHLAEQVVEDAAFIAAQELHQYTEDEGFGPWIRNVIRYAVLKRFEDMGVRSYIANDQIAFGIERVFASVDALPRETWQGRCNELWKSTKRLPVSVRETLRLHYLGGQSRTKIAKKLTRNPATISKALTRARIAIGELIHNKAEEYL